MRLRKKGLFPRNFFFFGETLGNIDKAFNPICILGWPGKYRQQHRKQQEQEEKKLAMQALNPKDFYVCELDTLYTTGFIEEEDAEANIQFMNAEGEDQGQDQIKCATLSKLIERVTYHTNYGL